jgi:hypothetical protein
LPWNSHATKSNWKKPQRPQFRAPMITRKKANKFKHFILLLPDKPAWKNLPTDNLIIKKRNSIVIVFLIAL